MAVMCQIRVASHNFFVDCLVLFAKKGETSLLTPKARADWNSRQSSSTGNDRVENFQNCQPAELGKVSSSGFSDNPFSECPMLAIACIALTVCLLLLSLYCWRLRKVANPPVRTFRSGQQIGQIAYSVELAQVGPVRTEFGSDAFHDSIHLLARSCTGQLESVEGNSIAVTSASAGTGVTTIAVALARDLAHQGQRTLLLDMNFASPMVHQATATFSIHGISNYLMSGQVDGIVMQDSSSPLDIIGVGNVPVRIFQTFLQGGEFKDCLLALMALYDRIIIDCPPITDISPGISRIAALCDLRLLVVDVQVDSEKSAQVQASLRSHRRWQHGTTLLLRNKVKSDAAVPAAAPVKITPSQPGFRPIQSEAWIIRQPDELYTLKLTELSYRPMLTKHQVSIYAGHQVATFRLTILGKPNYLLILGQFRSKSEALSAAHTLGLNQPSVIPVTFATVKQGIKHELNRKTKNGSSPAVALSD